MSENSRIYPSLNPSGSASFPDCHLKLCRQFMDRYRSVLPAEKLYALAHIFADTQLLLRGNVDQTMELVLDLLKDQIPEGGATTEMDHVENRCHWEREAEPEFPTGMKVVDVSMKDAEVAVKQEPEEMVEESLPGNLELECPKAEETVSLGSRAEINQSRPFPRTTVSEPPKKAPLIWPSAFDSIHKRNVPAHGRITLDSVYQNLVLFDDDFFKTQTYFNRIGCGQLELNVKFGTDHRAHATIHVAHLILSQASAEDHSKVIQITTKQFFQDLKDQCYNVETLHPKSAFQRTTNIVQRIPLNGQMRHLNASKNRPLIEIDPARYEQIMRDFHTRDNGCHLVFAADFTDLECNVMQGIAARLQLSGRVYDLPTTRRKRFLVLARELPPQEIVRRIVAEQDPTDAELSFQYRVTPPKRKGKGNVPVVAEKPAGGAKTSFLACSSSQQQKPEAKKSNAKLEWLAETLADLTRFAPVKTLRSVDDVYRNLVLFGTDFNETANHFNNTNVGMLQISSSQNLKDGAPCGGFSATVQVGKFVLAEARTNGKKSARIAAQAAFFKKAKLFCYQIHKKQPAKREILVTRQEDADFDHYKRLIEDFSEDSHEKVLVFGSKFPEADRKNLTKFARSLNLRTCRSSEIENHRLRVYGRQLPALVIVERIVVAEDAKLSAIYEVIPPRIGARGVEAPPLG